MIRKANEKTVEVIHAEIRAAQARTLAPGEQTIDLAEKMPSPRTIRFFARMPFFVRKAVYGNRLYRDPSRVKRTMEAVSVTSVGMFGKDSAGSSWGIPVEFHPLTELLGSIARKPAVVEEGVEGLHQDVLFEGERFNLPARIGVVWSLTAMGEGWCWPSHAAYPKDPTAARSPLFDSPG